jgi:hypothetical protein
MTQSDFLVAADLLETHGSPLAEMLRQVAQSFPESIDIADGGRWRVQCNAGILCRTPALRSRRQAPALHAQPKPSRLRVCIKLEYVVDGNSPLAPAAVHVSGESYDDIPCTCTANCQDPCRGDCGCEACTAAYGDFLTAE